MTDRTDRPHGQLVLVATPIGNLEDLSPRAARTLAEADLVACEDTRRTGRLLAHIGASVPLLAVHDHNESRRADGICDRVEAGEVVALVSDAGTPGISDPGYDVDVHVEGHVRTMVDYWMGRIDFADAVRSGDLVLQGPRALVQSLPTWFKQSDFASVELP